MRITLLILPLFLLFFNDEVKGHGALDEQIKELTTRIKQEPKNAKLFLKRGQLYAQHEEFFPARQDYLAARSLDQNLRITDLLLAELYLQNKLVDTALFYVNTFLTQNPSIQMH